jgi:hypothetical protein
MAIPLTDTEVALLCPNCEYGINREVPPNNRVRAAEQETKNKEDLTLSQIVYRKTLKPHVCGKCNHIIPKANHVATYNSYETAYGYRCSIRYTTRKYLCHRCTTKYQQLTPTAIINSTLT